MDVPIGILVKVSDLSENAVHRREHSLSSITMRTSFLALFSHLRIPPVGWRLDYCALESQSNYLRPSAPVCSVRASPPATTADTAAAVGCCGRWSSVCDV